MRRINDYRGRACSWLKLLLTGLCVFTPLSALSHESNDCVAELVSKRQIEQWKISPKDIEHWLSRESTAFIVRANLELTADLKTAPGPALKLISILSYTQLGDQNSERALIRHLQNKTYVKNLEIVLGRDLKSLATPLTNLFFAQRLASGDAKAWLKRVLSSPFKTLLIADAMSRLSPPIQGEPFYLFKAGYNFSRWKEMMLRFRNQDGADLNWNAVARANPLFAFEIAKLIYAADVKALEIVKVFNSPNASRSIRDPEVEDMIEWVAAKLTASSSHVTDPPESWTKLYRTVDSFIRLPASKTAKLTDKTLRGFTRGDLLLVDLVPALVGAINSESGGDLLEELADPEKRAQQIRLLLMSAPAYELYRQEDASLVASLVLTLANTNIPTSAEMRSVIKNQTTRIVQELMRLSPRESNSQTTQVPSANFVAENDPFGEIELEHQFEAWTPYQLPTTEASPRVIVEGDLLDAFFNQEKSINDLQPDTAYDVTFARTNPKFTGVQKVVFAVKLVEQIRNYQTKEVSPLSWLRAIKMGIAKSHGERGIKILSFLEGDETFFEVKLLVTSYRILGRFHDGIWHLENLVNTHH